MLSETFGNTLERDSKGTCLGDSLGILKKLLSRLLGLALHTEAA